MNYWLKKIVIKLYIGDKDR